MKRLFGIFFILSLSLKLCAQEKMIPQDSIKVFYAELFSALKKNYLHRNTVNWQVAESETIQSLKQYATFENSLSEVKILFDKIGATHCNIYYKENKYAATGKKIPEEDYSKQWKNKYNSKPVFEIKVLNERFGYILMPKMIFFDISPQSIHKIAQPLYDQIANLKTNNKIEGWILDLRMNTGGNSWPMLLALYDLLGDNSIGGSLNANKKMTNKIKLVKGKYYDNGKQMSHIDAKGEMLDHAKVAVISGLFTASSGEVIALAFKGRQNTIFIGERTYGATTGNIYWPLPFDITMALTTTYDTDRNGNYFEQIIPDIVVSKQDNFDDLLLDKNIQEAIKFINNK